MQHQSRSLTKLPDISIKKKDKIVAICRKFQQNVKAIEQKQQTNLNTMNKFDLLYKINKRSISTRKLLPQEIKQDILQIQKQRQSLTKWEFIKSGTNLNKIQAQRESFNKRKTTLNFRQKLEKQPQILKSKIGQVKQFQKLPISTPRKLNLREIAQANAVDFQSSKRKKSALVTKTQKQKQVLPFYSTSQHKNIQLSYTKISENIKGQKVKVRLTNGTVKQVSKKLMYYKVGVQQQIKQHKKEQQQKQELQNQIKNSKFNIDYSYLKQIIEKLDPKMPINRKNQLMQDLIQNYKMSICIFNNNFTKPGWIKTNIKQNNLLSFNKQVMHNLQKNLVCTEELQFLRIFQLSKNKYIPMLVQAEYLVRKITDFVHFDVFQLITVYNVMRDKQKINEKQSAQNNNQNNQQEPQQMTNKQPKQAKMPHATSIVQKTLVSRAQDYKNNKLVTNLNIDTHLKNKKSQIQLKIYQIQTYLQKIKLVLYKDIEHIIKLNAKLVGTPYQQYVRNFLDKFAKYLCIMLRSVISKQLYRQLDILGNYYLQYFHSQFNGVLSINHPDTQFYKNINKINKPFITPFTNIKIMNGAILIMLDAKIKKMKRKNLRNIYKFLIDSRQQIRIYPDKMFQKQPKQNANPNKSKNSSANQMGYNKQRIFFNSCVDILQQNIIENVKKYITFYVSNSQNINGCINNININVHQYGEFQKFVQKIHILAKQIQKDVVSKYQEYFSYWQVYLMEKPYIEQMVALFKRINGVRLMQDQMRNLQSDLKIIKSFPDTIKHKIVHINITQIKTRIISTITSNITKIGKASEQVLQRLLTIGQTQTQKAQKLNQITPYSTIGQYINFAKALSARGVQKSIERVALNAIVLLQNWNFLERNNFPIKTRVMGQFLESCVWVRILRKAANANRAKLFVDPQIFTIGVTQKKYKIYYKYMFIVRQIAEVIKLTEIAQWDRYAVLAKNIYGQLQQISKIAKDISHEQGLLQMQYYQKAIQNEVNSKQEQKKKSLQSQQKTKQALSIKITKHHKEDSNLKQTKHQNYKQNFSFFIKETMYMSKFAVFWQYILKFKNQIDNVSKLTLYEVNGENTLKVIRQGQQVLFQLKITSVNKRLLGLVEKIYRQLQPYVKYSRIIKVLCNGSESARTRAIHQIKRQIELHILKKNNQFQEKRLKALQQQKRLEQQINKNIIEIVNMQNPIQKLQQFKQSDQKQKQPITKQNKIQTVQQDTFERDTIKTLQKFLRQDQMNITLKQFIDTPLPTLDFYPLYQMYIAQRKREQVTTKIKKISTHIKSIQVITKQYTLCPPIQPLQIIIIPDSLIIYICQQLQSIRQLTQQLNQNLKQNKSIITLIQIYQQYSKDLQNCTKKLTISLNSLQKMKRIQKYIQGLYSLFQLVLPSLMPASSNIYSQYKTYYDQFVLQYNKKLQIIKKIGYSNIYQDRVRINYDEQIQKFQQLHIKVYNHPIFGVKTINKNSNYIIKKQQQHIYRYFNKLPSMLLPYHDINNKTIQNTFKNMFKKHYDHNSNYIKDMLPDGWKNLTFSILYNQKDKEFYVVAVKLYTIHNQIINLKQITDSKDKNTTQFVKKLFNVQLADQQVIGQSQQTSYICTSGILCIIDSISKLISKSIQKQIIQLLPLIYQYHYNIKQIFTLYITLNNCLFQSIISSLYVIFYMDLLLVWQNDYDIMVLRDKIAQSYQNGYQPKQSQNIMLVQAIYQTYLYFIGIIDVIVRRRLQQNDRQIQGSNLDQQKLRKKLIIQFIPTLIFQQFQLAKNKKISRQWLFAEKKKKQDDFINQTHLNPVFISIMGKINIYWQKYKEMVEKIEFKDIEKKQEVNIYKLGDSLILNSAAGMDGQKVSKVSKQNKDTNKKVKIQENKDNLVILGCNRYKARHYYEILCLRRYHMDEIQQSLNTTWLITQAQRHRKFLITNCHPNTQILGYSIIHKFIKIQKNPIHSQKLQQIQQKFRMKLKQKQEQRLIEQHNNLIINSIMNINVDLRSSNASGLQTPRNKKLMGLGNLGKYMEKKNKNVVQANLYQLAQSFDYQHLEQIQQKQVQLLQQYNKNILQGIILHGQGCYCINVQDNQSLQWVIQYLVDWKKSIQLQYDKNNKQKQQNQGRRNESIVQNLIPTIYIYCINIDSQNLYKNHNLQHCLVYYSQKMQAVSDAVIHAQYNQNKAFSQKLGHNKQQSNPNLATALKNIGFQQKNHKQNQLYTTFNPLLPYLHSNPLLKHYSCLYPSSAWLRCQTKIYQNTLLSPLNLSLPASSNITRSPLNPKYRQLIQKCIIKYYSQLKIQQYLQMAQMQPITHGIHYNAFFVQLGKNKQNCIQSDFKYVVEFQIKNIMASVWHILLQQIVKLQMGQNNTNTVNNQNMQAHHNNVAIYVVPVHSMSISQLLGSMTHMIMNNNKNNNNYPTCRQGLFQQIIKLAIMASNLVMGDKSPSTINSPNNQHKYDKILNNLKQFLIPNPNKTQYPKNNVNNTTHNLINTSRWFILDLTVVNPITQFIYNWLCSAFHTHLFVFMNQHSMYWDHNAVLRIINVKKHMYSTSSNANILNMNLFKIIVIVHQELINCRKNSIKRIQVLPILNLLSNYNPLLQITIQLPPRLQILKTSCTKLPNFLQIISIFKKIIIPNQDTQQKSAQISLNLYNRFTPNMIYKILTKLQILLNQLRKSRLANGLYIQSQIPQKQKKNIFMCSIQLRQKIKTSYQKMLQMQQIQRILQAQRKQLYRCYTNIFNKTYNKNNEGKPISFNPNYLSIQQIKQQIPANYLTKEIQNNLSKDLQLLQYKFIPDVGIDVIAKIIVQVVYHTITNQCDRENEKQKISKWLLLQFGIGESLQVDNAIPKKNVKKNNKSKKNNNILITINHPNLLNIPTIQVTSTNPYPQPFSFTKFIYNVAIDQWQQIIQLSSMWLLPSPINCTLNTTVNALHPSQILRLNPYINMNTNAKQYPLKVFCNSARIKYELQGLTNWADQNIIWSRYLAIYKYITTIVRFIDQDSIVNENNWQFQNNLLNILEIGQIANFPITIDMSNINTIKNIDNNKIRKWLSYKYSPITNEKLYKTKVHKMSYQLYQKSTNTIAMKQIDNYYGWRSYQKQDKIDRIILLNTKQNKLYNKTMQQINKYIYGIPLLIHYKNQQNMKRQIRNRVIGLTQLVMKQKNIQNVLNILIIPENVSESSPKKKSKKQVKNVGVKSQVQLINNFKCLKQINIDCLIILAYTQPHQQLYLRILPLLFNIQYKQQTQISLQQQIQNNNVNYTDNRYTYQLQLYGIYIQHSQQKLLQLFNIIIEMNRQIKYIKNQIAMNTSTNIQSPELQDYKNKAQLNIGRAIIDYIVYCVQFNKIRFYQADFGKYVPRYLLPKPKKLKTNNLLSAQPYFAYNGYYAEFIPLKILQAMQRQANQSIEINANTEKPNQNLQKAYQNIDIIKSSAQQASLNANENQKKQIKSLQIQANGQQNKQKKNKKLIPQQQQNEMYIKQMYKIQHNYTSLFELNQNIILSVLQAQYTNVGMANVDLYIQGFLLYCKSRIFIQSQNNPNTTANNPNTSTTSIINLLNQSTTSSNIIKIHKQTNNPLHYHNINNNTMSYNKQFSLFDIKVTKIIHQYWKSMKKPIIKITYKCLHSLNNKQYNQQLQWILQVDIDNNKTFSYKKITQNNTINQEKQNKKKNLSKATNKQKYKLNRSHSHSQSMMTNQNQDHIMGILNFIQISNLDINISQVRKYYGNKNVNKRKNNQFLILFVYDRHANPKQIVPEQSVNKEQLRKLQGLKSENIYEPKLLKQLNNSVWIRHKETSLPPIQSTIPNVNLPLHLHTIYDQKLKNLSQQIRTLYQQKLSKQYIPQGIIGKKYIPAITKKKQQFKDIILYKKQQLASKKQVYDNCRLQIQTLNNKIQQAADTVKQNQQKIEEWKQLLVKFKNKLQFYVGQNQFQEAKQKLLEIPRKNIQKYVLKAAYIQDNPLNLSFIYRFNVLADNSFFPDKNFQVLGQQYNIDGKYPVFEQQKKQFIKLLNMGRLNAMLQNEDYWPNQDQIVNVQKIRKQFKYLGSLKLDTNIITYSQQNLYSVANLLIKDELNLIQQKSQTPSERVLHSYISLLSAHAYIKHMLITNKQKLQKDIKTYQQQSKILINKIRDNKTILKQQQQKQVTHKSKYEKSMQQVKNAEQNERIFMEIAVNNTKKMGYIFQKYLFAINNDKKNQIIEEIGKFIVYKLSQRCQQCDRKYKQNSQAKQYHPLSIEARRYLFYLLGIKRIKKQIVSFKTTSISQLYNDMYKFLITNYLKLQPQVLIHQCSSLKHYNYGSKIDHRKYNIINHTANPSNATTQQLQYYILSSLFPQYSQQHNSLLKKLQRIQNILNTNLQHFVQKIDIIQSRQIQSIKKFQISQDIIDKIMQNYNNQCSQIQGLDFVSDWASKNQDGFKLANRIMQYVCDRENIITIFKQLRVSVTQMEHIWGQTSVKYYLIALGQIVRRSNNINTLINSPNLIVPYIRPILTQLIYNHIPIIYKYKNHSNVFSQDILTHNINVDTLTYEHQLHKLTIDKVTNIKQNCMNNLQLINTMSGLDNMIGLQEWVIFVQASQVLQQMIENKVKVSYGKLIYKQYKDTYKYNQQKDIKQSDKNNQQNRSRRQYSQQSNQQHIQQSNQQHQQPQNQPIYLYYQPVQDTTAPHYIIFHIHNYSSNLQQLKQSIHKLKQEIVQHKQQNVYYIFIVGSKTIIGYVQQQIQPIYRIYCQDFIFGVLKNNTNHNNISNGSKSNIQQDMKLSYKNNKQLAIQLIGKLFNYYTKNVITYNHNNTYLELFTCSVYNEQPLTQHPPNQQQQPQPNTQNKSTPKINQNHILYPHLQSLALLYKYLSLNSMIAASTVQYRILKKLIKLFKINETDNTADIQDKNLILQGYQIYICYYANRAIGQSKYSWDDIKCVVEQVNRQGYVPNKAEQYQNLTDQDIEKLQIRAVMKRRYNRFIQFLISIHEQICLFDQHAQTLTSTQLHQQFQLGEQILIKQNCLHQSHLIQNKNRYLAKTKDAGAQILKKLFNKPTHKTNSKSTYNQNQIIDQNNLLLADPKVYIILNKTFKRVINRMATAKANNKNNKLLVEKQGKGKRRMFNNYTQANKILHSLKQMRCWHQISSLHRIQFLLWIYSQLENIRINNLYLNLSSKANIFDKVESQQQQQKLKQIQANKYEKKKNKITSLVRFQLHFVQQQHIILEIQNINKNNNKNNNNNREQHIKTCIVQLQATVAQLTDKTSKFYKGLLFKYYGINQMNNMQQPIKLDNFKSMSFNKQQQFLKLPNTQYKLKDDNIQISSPSASNSRPQDSQSPISPALKTKKTILLTNNSLKQTNLNKVSCFTIPIYCKQTKIGVLQIDINLCRGFDPIRSYAVLL